MNLSVPVIGVVAYWHVSHKYIYMASVLVSSSQEACGLCVAFLCLLDCEMEVWLISVIDEEAWPLCLHVRPKRGV